MSVSYQEKIRKLIQCLPPKDCALANSLLDSRHLEELQILADSCIILKEREEMGESRKKRWTSVDRKSLEALAATVYEYRTLCGDIEVDKETIDDYYE